MGRLLRTVVAEQRALRTWGRRAGQGRALTEKTTPGEGRFNPTAQKRPELAKKSEVWVGKNQVSTPGKGQHVAGQSQARWRDYKTPRRAGGE